MNRSAINSIKSTFPFHVILQKKCFSLHSPMLLLFKWGNLGLFLFIFILFKQIFYRKNCWLQRDSNLNRRWAHWPLDHHHHGPKLMFVPLLMITYGCFNWFGLQVLGFEMTAFWLFFFLKMGETRPLFVYFILFTWQI